MARFVASLRLRLVLLVLVALVPAGVLIFKSAQSRRTADIEQVQTHAQEVARLSARQYELSIEATGQFLLPLAEVLSAQFKQAQTAQAARAAGGGAPAATAPAPAATTPTPAPTPVDVTQSTGGLSCRRFVTSLLQNNPRISFLSIALPTGQLICTSGTDNPSSDPEPDLVQRIVDARGFVVGPTRVQPGKRPTIHAGYPVAGLDGTPAAVIYVAHDLDVLGATLSEAQLPVGSSATLLSATGDILARYPRSDLPLESGPRSLDVSWMAAQPDAFSFETTEGGSRVLMSGIGLGPFGAGASEA
ncbi:MAG: hypothetical protein EPO65_09115, partial [Dehalococcoidia bacterium]